MKEYMIQYGSTIDTLMSYHTDDEEFVRKYYLEQLEYYPIVTMAVREVSEWEEV